ncbi:hypothetical protein ScalyP_jg1016 [Parmales sp. scaly parma]|nr:hypothetical protein ScalyP_jg1016 [Parmales sp. scaly parma]
MASASASAGEEDCVNDLLTVETYQLSEGDVTPTTPTLQDRGQATVSPEMSQKLSLECDSTTCSSSSIQTRVMTASSTLHSDRYANGDTEGGALNERVSFLILNDNPKAKTIIDQGVVNLLGPWGADTKFSVGVGDDSPSSTAPSGAPSEAPSAAPSAVPSAAPSALSTAAPSSAPSDSPQQQPQPTSGAGAGGRLPALLLAATSSSLAIAAFL